MVTVDELDVLYERIAMSKQRYTYSVLNLHCYINKCYKMLVYDFHCYTNS